MPGLKQLFESQGKEKAMRIIRDLLVEEKMTPEEFSIREIWEATVGPVAETLSFGMPRSKLGLVDVSEAQSAVGTSAFPVITGMLISKKVLAGYNLPGYIGDKLVDNMPSKMKQERIAGFTALEGPKTVAEGMPYEETGIGEKYVTTDTTKKGRLISITEEMVYFDQTGQILRRAADLGEKCRLDKEKTILNGIQDVSSTVYAPLGVATALYHAANHGNLQTGNLLVDWTDIDAIERLAAVQTDDSAAADIIYIMLDTILIPRALMATAWRITHATKQTGSVTAAAAPGGVVTETMGMYPNLNVLVSPLLDAQSSANWYMGGFKKAFIWQDIWPLQTLRAKRGNEQEFERDIVARFKVRYYGGIAALDYRHVYKSTA